MFQVCDALLDILGDLAQNYVLLSLVLGKTLDAVEVPAYAVTELNFVLRVECAVEFLGVEVECGDRLWSLDGSCGLEFGKGSS